jgi:hypothetical protein
LVMRPIRRMRANAAPPAAKPNAAATDDRSSSLCGGVRWLVAPSILVV